MSLERARGAFWVTGPDTSGEDLADGATWLLDLVAAVDHLRRGYRPSLTVWDAIAEAVACSVRVESTDPHQPGDPEPDIAALCLLDTSSDTSTAAQVQAALRQWVTTMAARYNSGQHWPHPTPRRGFPPPTLAV